MLLFSITKRINKFVAPKLLSWSLRSHEASASSSASSSVSSSHFLIPTTTSSFLSGRLLLPLAQRLVSIEVLDDYLQIRRAHYEMNNNVSTSSSSSWWDKFVDKTWSHFFQDYYERQTSGSIISTVSSSSSSTERERLAELQAQQLYNAKQKKRWEQRRQRLVNGGSTRKGQQQQQQQQVNNDSGDAYYCDDHHHNELLEFGDQRVRLLERYIRPALLSSSSSSSSSFVKWLRGEYLIAKYGLIVQKAAMEHPELRGEGLPSVKTVIQAFGMQNWNRHKVPIPLDTEEETDIKSTNGGGGSSSSSSVSIEHIIHHKLGGQILHAGPLNAYFEMKRLRGQTQRGRGGSGGDSCYELWTREYIFGLAQYLLARIAEMDHRDRKFPKETIILDVGAGDGRLSCFLRRAMEESLPTNNDCRALPDSKTESSTSTSSSNPTPKLNAAIHPTTLPTIIATDDGSWNSSRPMDSLKLTPFSSSHHHSDIHVEKLSAIESLRKYGPTSANYKNRRLIVLCSWMPPGQDWTADFRKPIDVDGNADNFLSARRVVDEYILIGEADNGTCGDNWFTWGNSDFIPSDAYHHTDEDVAPYLKDGYKRVDLTELSALQFSRFDCRRSSESMTVSFRWC